MSASLAAAFEQAMKKSKGKGKPTGGLIHPSFPPQAAAQPNFMGSQSMSPSDASSVPEQALNVPPVDRGAYGPGY